MIPTPGIAAPPHLSQRSDCASQSSPIEDPIYADGGHGACRISRCLARVGLATLPLRGRPSQGAPRSHLCSRVSPINEVCEEPFHLVRRSGIRRADDGSVPRRGRGCPSGTREPSQACSVEAARTASAVRGDQDHEDRDHCQRQTYSQPHLPVPLSPSVDPARAVHLEPPFRASSSFTRMCPRDRFCRHG